MRTYHRVLVFQSMNKKPDYLQFMTRVLNSLLIALRRLTVLKPAFSFRILTALDAELALDDEGRGEMHHHVCGGQMVSEQELLPALLERGLEEVHVLDDVLAHPFFRLLDVAVLLVPARVEDRNAVKRPCRLCRMHPLQDLIAFGVAERR